VGEPNFLSVATLNPAMPDELELVLDGQFLDNQRCENQDSQLGELQQYSIRFFLTARHGSPWAYCDRYT